MTELLFDALGEEVLAILHEDCVNDLLLNEDGRLWVGRIAQPIADTGLRLAHWHALTALNCVADYTGRPLTAASPIVNSDISELRVRIAGAIPPVTLAPVFAIRKHSAQVLPLSAFRDAPPHALRKARFKTFPDRVSAAADAVDARKFVLVSGATGSGKSTLISSLMALPSVVRDRCGIIEDVRELQLLLPNRVSMLSNDFVDMHALVRFSLRLRLDRIIIGEVRYGPAALEMVTAANTGHTGGMCSIHANSAVDALDQLAGLCYRETKSPPHREVARAVGCVVHATRTGLIEEVIDVLGYENGMFVTEMVA